MVLASTALEQFEFLGRLIRWMCALVWRICGVVAWANAGGQPVFVFWFVWSFLVPMTMTVTVSKACVLFLVRQCARTRCAVSTRTASILHDLVQPMEHRHTCTHTYNHMGGGWWVTAGDAQEPALEAGRHRDGPRGAGCQVRHGGAGVAVRGGLGGGDRGDFRDVLGALLFGGLQAGQ